ncbi:Citrate lyase subunit beta-like protein [Variovorax sp. PBS-H4]|uniref:HpcH/HpaI aldolase/citrate lyase family protein n=1 Tax=Variovorax sp. PBS-H4 TaxID=434008 RepID=UPI001316FC7D|nr:CoA ester lyase [Variovorax sp. PBS-H4]VTU35680.1 Citrate lyase subunit beta-like protein [Variovorax sp. PBS-H4]
MAVSAVARARSFLFVPASRPERFAKAWQAGADCVILDLEDAVPADRKDAARDLLAQGLGGFSPGQLASTLVRINAAGTPWHEADVCLVADWVPKGLAGAMVPKAESAAALAAVAERLGAAAQLVPLVESLGGLDAVNLLAGAPQVARLAFGHLDFQLDLGMRCGPEEGELAPVRLTLVAASRRAALPAPIDGVTTDTGNRERQCIDAQRARAFGFGGKLCIHPAQVAPIHEAFSPTDSEVAWARRVIEGATARQGEAFSLDGRMVDLPVIRLAETILAQCVA